ncbi:response regulator transcription factor [Paenibacillus chartarius]|uniref:Response regulator transcription factor n=1 Tax=Paenibacillus chartarius TaxID=747481 RepID=A0ABV6DHY7_9BACL
MTEREEEVAHLLQQGLTNAQIGARLFLSEVTVKKYLRSLFDKFGVKNRTQLLVTMMEKRQTIRDNGG